MRKIQHITDSTPFVGAGLIILIIGVLLAALAFAIGWFLQLLEIQSVFDRLLPGWTAMNYFVTSILSYFVAQWLMKALPDYHLYP